MPIPEDIADQTIGSPNPGMVAVFVGPGSAHNFPGKKIPLDGRKYHCDGKVYFKNGIEERAKFDVDTSGFQFLVKESLVCFCNGLWYKWDEPELYEALGTTKEEALPLKWLPDRPLDHKQEGPYPMDPLTDENV